MLNKMNIKLILTLIGMVIYSPFLFAHSPDLSSLMIYEQNGKVFLVIKSSIAAFEGEVHHHYGKNSYKTPQEFNELAVKHFKKSCFVLVNSDTIKFVNPQIQLGHETTVFTEIKNMPQKITNYYVKNILFKDMPNNQCELIINHKDLPQKQFILNNENDHEVTFRLENNNWIIEEHSNSMFGANKFILGSCIILVIFIAIVFIRRKNIS